ncbi:sensor histidine kinase [Streptacidiphilus carbonis]|uniref:sensor histidine kinase n=1 Tax=Streptacidiphilus carbonis TaxID=105422 RepID=UPI0005A8A6C1|nr:sensor histidine kinase [Streptacidiphilus carbonis]
MGSKGPGSRSGPVNAVPRAPFGRRARRELAFCLLGLPFVVLNAFTVFFAVVLLLTLTGRQPWTVDDNPSPWTVLVAVSVVVLLTLLLVVSGGARRLGASCRWAVGFLLGEQVAAPPPPPGRSGRGRRGGGGLRAALGDGPSWRAVAYLFLKLPTALLEAYAALVFWGAGLVNLTYPFWWNSFRNHPDGTRLSPVPVVTPFDWSGAGHFQITTFPGTFAALGAGVGMLLAAPWVTRAVVAGDRWLIRNLLGPRPLAQRLTDLEHTRALAVDDAAARLRRLERDLHDGAQIRLATLALNLGMAKRKLGESGAVPHPDEARELVDAALQGAKDALSELRELARGIHPAVLDTGLADALATLVAGNAVPTELTADITVRPTPAIETIAYFCTAELLANATKHSGAGLIAIEVTQRAEVLVLRIADDGRGGADPARGSGLSGLKDRVAVVDGRLDITSPPGGPTRATVVLPLRA